MGLAEIPDAARLAKQMVVAHGAAGQDMDFAGIAYDDALAELAADSGELTTQTLIELTRLGCLAARMAALACEVSVEDATATVFRVYDEWHEEVVASMDGTGPRRP